MSETTMRPATVVDYAAWKRGYMPPSEHILIDQLSYRDARVNFSTDFGDRAFWLVTRGWVPTTDQAFKLNEMIGVFMIENMKAEKQAAKEKVEAEPPALLASHQDREE